jgi:cardiolipin synthase
LAEATKIEYHRDLGDTAEVKLSVWRRRDWRERGREALGWAARRIL